jgi:tetratricopeptide (TPR) repeat protein
MKNAFVLLFLLILLSGCSLQDPITRSQELSKKGKFPEAIKVLQDELKKNSGSVPVKSLLAQAYSDYGLALCQDVNKPPRVKYPMAKEQFAMALELNPYQQDAKEMYEMIEKIQESFRENKME